MIVDAEGEIACEVERDKKYRERLKEWLAIQRVGKIRALSDGLMKRLDEDLAVYAPQHGGQSGRPSSSSLPVRYSR